MERLFKVGDIWYCRVRNERGRIVRVSTKCRDKEAARLVARNLERTAADPAHAAAHETTLDAAAGRFLASVTSRGRAADTTAFYKKKLGHVLRVLGTDRSLAEIDATAVDRFVEQRQAEGAANNSIAKELTALRGVLKVARRRGEYVRDVASVMPIGFSSGYEPRKRAITPERVSPYLSTFTRVYRRAHLAFVLAAGARDMEAARARPEDIDFTASTVLLRGSKTEKSWRVVPILPFLEPLFRFALDHGGGKGGLLFRPWKGIRTDMKRACERLGWEPLSPNDLRRSVSTWLRDSGASADAIGAYLGHADSRMVERVYGRFSTPAALGSALTKSISSSRDQRNGPQPAEPRVGTGGVFGDFLVPRDGVEPPTRGFSSPAASGDSRWNPRVLRGVGSRGRSNLSSLDRYINGWIRRLREQHAVAMAARRAVAGALRQDRPKTLRAIRDMGVGLGLVDKGAPLDALVSPAPESPKRRPARLAKGGAS